MGQGLLYELPKPENIREGWPWTEESVVETAPADRNLPKISIITPSYNQGEFLEETIRSVLLQNYPNLEYIIIDGGSTDNSVEIIRKYEKWLTFWKSEPDKGQSDAINQGFDKATGLYGNWINSDDYLTKNALWNFSQIIGGYPSETLFIGYSQYTDKEGTKLWHKKGQIKTIEELLDLKNFWRKNTTIAQQSVMFNIDTFKKAGGLNENNHYSMDFELWGDLLILGNKIEYIEFPIGVFRKYDGQKISFHIKATKSLVSATKKLVLKNRSFAFRQKTLFYWNTIVFQYLYLYRSFRSRIGIRRRLKKALN